MCAFYFFITSLEQKASNSSVKSMNDIESCNLFLLNEGESSSAVLKHYSFTVSKHANGDRCCYICAVELYKIQLHLCS